MNYESSPRKNLIIVYDPASGIKGTETGWFTNTHSIASLLQSKISDEYSSSVSSAIWTVKEFKDSRAKLETSSYILHIGEHATMKNEGKFFNLDFAQGGMFIKKSGKQAWAYVQSGVPLIGKNLKRYRQLAGEYGIDIPWPGAFFSTKIAHETHYRVLAEYIYREFLPSFMNISKDKQDDR